MAPDPWFSTYDSTCQLAQEIAEKIQQRNQYERNGENTTKLTVTIRALLQKLKEKIALLKDLLLRAVATHQITQLEGDRRQNLLDDLVTRERLLLASFKNEGAEPDLIRSSLMTGGAKRGAPNPWLLEEPEETRGLGFDEIRQQQQKIIQEQDAGLDALSSIISRQKQMGQEIGNELDEQNDVKPTCAQTVHVVTSGTSAVLVAQTVFPSQCFACIPVIFLRTSTVLISVPGPDTYVCTWTNMRYFPTSCQNKLAFSLRWPPTEPAAMLVVFRRARSLLRNRAESAILFQRNGEAP
uniref:t-SNARE coiled-coil homology domain-containing protein n=1 Tax=Capra hircus TaxID=9925 RepID=A0A8C2S9G1_CAPHI